MRPWQRTNWLARIDLRNRQVDNWLKEPPNWHNCNWLARMRCWQCNCLNNKKTKRSRARPAARWQASAPDGKEAGPRFTYSACANKHKIELVRHHTCVQAVFNMDGEPKQETQHVNCGFNMVSAWRGGAQHVECGFNMVSTWFQPWQGGAQHVEYGFNMVSTWFHQAPWDSARECGFNMVATFAGGLNMLSGDRLKQNM